MFYKLHARILDYIEAVALYVVYEWIGKYSK